jgi:hypothetical protein
LIVYLALLAPLSRDGSLKVGRIGILRHTVTVAEQRTNGENGAMVEQDPKSKRGFRTFTVSEGMVEILTEHLAGRGVIG